MPRQHAQHALAGVWAQDVLEGDTGVAETQRCLVGGNDGGHGRGGVQVLGHDAGCLRRMARDATLAGMSPARGVKPGRRRQ